MIRISILALVVALGGGLLPAQAQLEDLRAVRGDLLVGRLNGEVVVFEVDGIWVPTPPGLRAEAEYRGAEARSFVSAILERERIVVRALGARRPGDPVPVQVLVGAEPGQDLAVVLADAGLALWAPASRVDPAQAKAVRQAEGGARRALRGLHDGGFQAFNWSQSTHRDFGVELWQPNLLRVGGGGRALSSTASSSAAISGPSSRNRDQRPPSRSTWNHVARSNSWARDAGLPPDQGHHSGSEYHPQ